MPASVSTAVLTRPITERRDRRPQTVNDLIAEPLALRPFALWVISHPAPETPIGSALDAQRCPVAHYIRQQLMLLCQVPHELIVSPYLPRPQARFLLKGERQRRVWLLDEDVATFARAVDRLRGVMTLDRARVQSITRVEAAPLLWQLLGAHDECL